jgi:hypothetical protein
MLQQKLNKLTFSYSLAQLASSAVLPNTDQAEFTPDSCKTAPISANFFNAFL